MNPLHHHKMALLPGAATGGYNPPVAEMKNDMMSANESLMNSWNPPLLSGQLSMDNCRKAVPFFFRGSPPQQ